MTLWRSSSLTVRSRQPEVAEIAEGGGSGCRDGHGISVGVGELRSRRPATRRIGTTSVHGKTHRES